MPKRKQKSYLTAAQLARRLSKVKVIALDVDGVLTDDHLYIGADNFELKRFHIGDGLNIVLAMRSGLEVVIVSARYSEATTSRMNDLGVRHVLQQQGNKLLILGEYLKPLGYDLSQVAFVGNDILDIPLMREVAVKIAVADAYPELKREVDYVTKKKGGNGAVREVLDLYFKGKKLDPVAFLR
jgi:3-deoxy-D-manno-octulosonate 8-phosphate phosphatase (KDO 8-P phosphatase)